MKGKPGRQDVTVYNLKRQVICLHISEQQTCCSGSEGLLDVVQSALDDIQGRSTYLLLD